MADLLTSKYPVTLLRTAGGFYLITSRQWGKMCSLRERSYVPLSLHLEPLMRAVEIMAGTDARNPTQSLFREVGVDQLRPGPHGVRLHGRGMNNWVRTSPLLAVYQGVYVQKLVSPGRFLLVDASEAWLIINGTVTRLLENGWNSPPQNVTATELFERLPNAVMVQLRQEHHPDPGADEFLTAAPGWVPAYQHLAETLSFQGVTVRSAFVDPVIGVDPELVLTDVPTSADGTPGAAVQAAIDEFDRACDETCQDCGNPGEYAALPSPYLVHHYRLCAACLALRLLRQQEELTVNGGHTKLFAPGETVTVWRSQNYLHLATESGYIRLARLRGSGRARPRWPGPRLLDLPEGYFAVRSLRDDIRGLHSAHPVDELSGVLPGMHIEVAGGAQPRTEFTILDAFHGVGATSIDDEHCFLVTQADAHSRSDRAWLVEHGVATRLLADGWDSTPDTSFVLGDLLDGRCGETGIIRLDTIRHGVSGTRTGFDLFAPGWIPLLDEFLAQVRARSEMMVLAEAEVSPLYGTPLVRLSHVKVTGHPGDHRLLSGPYRTFVTDCLRTCAVCGDWGRLTTLPAPERYGSVRRCLCLTHEEEEYDQWNT